jgi:hypothetical protein
MKIKCMQASKRDFFFFLRCYIGFEREIEMTKQAQALQELRAKGLKGKEWHEAYVLIMYPGLPLEEALAKDAEDCWYDN